MEYPKAAASNQVSEFGALTGALNEKVNTEWASVDKLKSIVQKIASRPDPAKSVKGGSPSQSEATDYVSATQRSLSSLLLAQEQMRDLLVDLEKIVG